jgi:hypothetical protein
MSRGPGSAVGRAAARGRGRAAIWARMPEPADLSARPGRAGPDSPIREAAVARVGEGSPARPAMPADDCRRHATVHGKNGPAGLADTQELPGTAVKAERVSAVRQARALARARLRARAAHAGGRRTAPGAVRRVRASARDLARGQTGPLVPPGPGGREMNLPVRALPGRLKPGAHGLMFPRISRRTSWIPRPGPSSGRCRAIWPMPSRDCWLPPVSSKTMIAPTSTRRPRDAWRPGWGWFARRAESPPTGRESGRTP